MKIFFISLLICILSSYDIYSQSSADVLKSAIWYDNETLSSHNQSKSHFQKSAEGADSTVLLNFHIVKTFSEAIPSLSMLYDLSVTSRLTVIVVYHSADTVSEHGIWSVYRGGKQVTGLTDKRLLRPNNDYAYPVKRRGIPLINTSIQSFSKFRGTSDSNYFTLGKAQLGDSLVSAFSGDMAECFVFDRFLKRSEALKIETYLAVKYGITLIGSDYVSPSDVILWDYESNKLYSNGIAGLGRDSVFGLYQKQGSSSEEDGLLTLGVGNFSTLNKENDYCLTDGNYLLWGHDAGTLNFEAVSGENSEWVLGRKWLIQSTNTKNNFFSTWVKFRVPEPYRDSTHLCYLVIDRSGNGDFPSKSVEYIAPDGMDSLGFVYFSGVKWNKLGLGKEVFSFSYRIDKEEETEIAEEMEENFLADKSKKMFTSPSEREKTLFLTEDANYQLYPSPTTGTYRLEAELPCASSIQVRVYTMHGVLVRSWQSWGQSQYSFTDYIETQGVYLIEVETIYGKKVFYLSVVKK